MKTIEQIPDSAADMGVWIRHRSKFRKVIGYAIGNDGRACYVTEHVHGYDGWQTYLVPVEEVGEVFRAERLGE